MTTSTDHRAAHRQIRRDAYSFFAADMNALRARVEALEGRRKHRPGYLDAHADKMSDVLDPPGPFVPDILVDEEVEVDAALHGGHASAACPLAI